MTAATSEKSVETEFTVLAEGKTKKLLQAPDSKEILVQFKDDATAFNAKKHAVITGKGELNARISTLLFNLLSAYRIQNCFLRLGEITNELIYEPLNMIPLEVVVRNVALGSLVKRYGFEEKASLTQPRVEFFLKSSDDPLIAPSIIDEMGLLPIGITAQQLIERSLEVNDLFVAFFESRGILCADFKLEFGVNAKGELCVGDELSPDNFRLRDLETGQVLDKDVFRLDLGDVKNTYEALLARLLEKPADALPLEVEKTYIASIDVTSRKNILSPESKAILDGLHKLGYAAVDNIQAGKHFEVNIKARHQLEARQLAEEMAEKLLANPVIEDYRVSVELQNHAMNVQ